MSEMLARALACASETEQATFFNAWFRELVDVCQANRSSAGTQLHYVTRHLSAQARDCIKEWASTVDFRREVDQREAEEVRVLEERRRALRDEVRQLEQQREEVANGLRQHG